MLDVIEILLGNAVTPGGVVLGSKSDFVACVADRKYLSVWFPFEQ
jgi:hypothetical protein